MSTREADKSVDKIHDELAKLRRRVAVSDEVMKELGALYGEIWIEACYDPTNAGSQALAKKLLPHIEAVNRELKLKP